MPKPRANLVTLARERGVVRDRESSQPPPRRVAVADHEETRHAPDRPAALGGKLRRESSLSVEPEEHRLGIRHDGLDLDDEQDVAARMARKDVDRAAFPANRERRLHLDGPAPAAKPTNERFDDRRMVLVQQPIEHLAAPSKPKVELRSERRDCLRNGVNRHARQLAAIDLRDLRSREAGLVRDVLLALARPDAKRSVLAPEPNLIHERIMARAASLAVIASSSAADDTVHAATGGQRADAGGIGLKRLGRWQLNEVGAAGSRNAPVGGV
jgi:hypothetical protein